MTYDVVIIGAGPAGLAAAIYGKRAGLDLLVIESNPVNGGQVATTYEVDNYPGLPGIGGMELGNRFHEHAEKLGAQFLMGTVMNISSSEGSGGNGAEAQSFKGSLFSLRVETEEGEESLEAKTIILCSGAEHAKLGIPGEEELCGAGVSYCATCDGAFFSGLDVAVAGGGDVAVEDAIFLARSCRKVYLIHRRDTLRAADVLQKQLMALPNVEICWDSNVVQVNGEDEVTSVDVVNKNTGEKQALEVSGLFVAVGIHPNTDALLPDLQKDQAGYILAGEDGVTNIPGVFAAGDVRKKPMRQIVTAVADGANALTSALGYLQEHSSR